MLILLLSPLCRRVANEIQSVAGEKGKVAIKVRVKLEKHVILVLDVLKVTVFSILTFHVFAFYFCVLLRQVIVINTAGYLFRRIYLFIVSLPAIVYSLSTIPPPLPRLSWLESTLLVGSAASRAKDILELEA